jgi:hypothetical protein
VRIYTSHACIIKLYVVIIIIMIMGLFFHYFVMVINLIKTPLSSL